jgi:hypothetical protein
MGSEEGVGSTAGLLVLGRAEGDAAGGVEDGEGAGEADGAVGGWLHPAPQSPVPTSCRVMWDGNALPARCEKRVQICRERESGGSNQYIDMHSGAHPFPSASTGITAHCAR